MKMVNLLKIWKLESLISSEAVDLLNRLVTFESKRIDLEGIVRHPWLTGKKSGNGDQKNSGNQGNDSSSEAKIGDQKQGNESKNEQVRDVLNANESCRIS